MHMNFTKAAEKGHEIQFKKFFEIRHLNLDKTQNFNYNYNEDRGKDPSLI